MTTISNLVKMIHTNSISRRNRLAAYARYVRWHISARVLGLPVVVPWVDGTRLLLSTGGAIGNYYVGLMEPADMAFAVHLLRPEDLFVDVGANVGVYTVLASGVCHCRSIAIEPLQNTMNHLLDNIHLNRIQQLVQRPIQRMRSH